MAEPTPPTKEGYTFAGWYSDAGLATPWDFSVGTVTGDMTLYAKWQESTTGIESHSVGVARAYPNPTTGEVTIENDGAEVFLYSLSGELLKRTYSSRIDLSGYPSGVYLLQTGSKTAKVVKQ